MKRDACLDDVDAALAAAAERYAGERFAFDLRQRLAPAQRRFDPQAWRDMADMGWLGVATAEDDGGIGLRPGSIALLARVAGAAGINEPLASTGFVAADVLRLHASPEQRARWTPLLLQGKLRVACAFAGDHGPVRAQGTRLHGELEVVPDADLADLLLVEAETAQGWRWHAVQGGAAGFARRLYPLLDGRGAATVAMDGCEADVLPQPASTHPRLVAALASAADALGAMETAFALTRDYVRTRRQFGVAIGSHQVVAHRAVDMFIRLEQCKAVLAAATQALQAGDDALAYHVHAAKAYVAPQARLLAQEAVQLHGGIGITEEYAVSHCLRRILVDERFHGGSRAHLRAFAASPKRR